jgi:hypothetical protein
MTKDRFNLLNVVFVVFLLLIPMNCALTNVANVIIFIKNVRLSGKREITNVLYVFLRY